MVLIYKVSEDPDLFNQSLVFSGIILILLAQSHAFS